MQGATRANSSLRVPYFPPPPKSATAPRTKLRKRSTDSESISTKSTSRLNWKNRTALQRSRLVLLPTLILLTITLLVLSIIYAYCVIIPHTTLTAPQQKNGTSVDISLFPRTPTFQNSSPPLPSPFSSNSTTKHTNLETSNRAHLTPTILIYTLLSPILSLLLPLIEYTLTHTTPHLLLRRRRTNLTLLIIYTLLTLGTIVSTSFWIHCELPTAAHTMHMKLCPVQTRGHFMYGIHEMSVAKMALSWAVVVGMMVHAGCLWRGRRDGSRCMRGAAEALEEEDAVVGFEKERGDFQTEMGKRERYEGRGVRFV